MSGATRPVSLLIAALGGEGGGVLTNWIIEAAAASGLPVQSTSIPGVAQRTGATTYYLEIWPEPWQRARRQAPGAVAGAGGRRYRRRRGERAARGGPRRRRRLRRQDRTTIIASTHRIYAISERMAMGDGRFDIGHLLKAIEEQAQSHILFDMEAAAQQANSVINAVMLGAIAGSGRLPVPVAAFEAAIRAEGKAVDANLRGFAAGLAALKQAGATALQPSHKRAHAAKPSLAALEHAARETMPQAAQDIIVEGLRRLAAYQDLRYARLYLDRLVAIRDADAAAGAGGKLLRETARHLAVRMSFEDVIRVAQAKTDPARLQRIRDELKLRPEEPLALIDFFKPGIDELCSILPPRLARPILAYAQRRGWLGKVYWGMEIKSSSVSGFLRLKLLASLRRWRRWSHRYIEEQAQIEAWLALVSAAATLSPALALEIADCARLIKGYGDTHARGLANYRKIEARTIRPALAGTYAAAVAIDAVAAARTAALADPEGDRLEKTLGEIEQRASRRIAAE